MPEYRGQAATGAVTAFDQGLRRTDHRQVRLVTVAHRRNFVPNGREVAG
jgi:hypothetical protein